MYIVYLCCKEFLSCLLWNWIVILVLISHLWCNNSGLRINLRALIIAWSFPLEHSSFQSSMVCAALLNVPISDWMCQISASRFFTDELERREREWHMTLQGLGQSCQQIFSYIAPDRKLRGSGAYILFSSLYPASCWSSWCLNWAKELPEFNHNRSRHYNLSLGIIDDGLFQRID